jgi:hypothetical protein
VTFRLSSGRPSRVAKTSLARQANPRRPTIRTLSALSRFDETPEEVLVELIDDGFVLLGEEAAIAAGEARQEVLGLLDGAALTEAELKTAAASKTTTLDVALRALVAEGRVVRTGAGRRGDPFRYALSPTVVPDVSPYGGETSSGRNPVGAADVEDDYPASTWSQDDEG